MALNFGTSTALTITAGSLAAGANRSSASVTVGNTNSVSSIMLTVNVLTSATAPTNNMRLLVYGYFSEDGINFGGNSSLFDNVDGTDKALTAIGSPSNLKYIGVIYKNQGANAVTLRGTFEVTQAFSCVPRKWGIVLLNDDGAAALGTTVTATYTEEYYS